MQLDRGENSFPLRRWRTDLIPLLLPRPGIRAYDTQKAVLGQTALTDYVSNGGTWWCNTTRVGDQQLQFHAGSRQASIA